MPANLNSDSALVTYTPNLDFNGSDSFVFRVTDGGQGSDPPRSDEATVSIAVSPTNDSPSVEAGLDQIATLNQPFSLTATFTDVDIGDVYTCTIDWGDGAPSEAGNVDQVADTCSSSHVYTSSAGFPLILEVTVTDSAGAPASDQIQVTVVCPGDIDCDGVPDESDNCPSVPNPDQTNTDQALAAAGWRMGAGAVPAIILGDLMGDVCDPDDDNDAVTDVDEQRIYGSAGFVPEQLIPCPSTGNGDPWPVAVAPLGLPDQQVDTTDVLLIMGYVFLDPSSPGYDVRLNLVGDPAGAIDTAEILFVLGFIGVSCLPP